LSGHPVVAGIVGMQLILAEAIGGKTDVQVHFGDKMVRRIFGHDGVYGLVVGADEIGVRVVSRNGRNPRDDEMRMGTHGDDF
jgi:hypothetical protein